MIIKKSLYPKTQRYSKKRARVILTEKLDGSNLAIFKLDGQIYFAQRKSILTPDEKKIKNYKGLYPWVQKNLDSLDLCEGSCICGEWIGAGHLKYPNLDKKFYMFAKANITEDYRLENKIYWDSYFQYSFESQVVPDFIGVVPTVAKLPSYPTREDLDSLYDSYRKEQDRNVEGFVINQNNVIRKYVRMKNGKLTEHMEETYGEEDI